MVDLRSRMTGIISEKDTDLKVTACNEVFVQYAGVPSDRYIIGFDDYDFAWHDYAGLYAVHELDVLRGENYSTVIPLTDADGNEAIFLHTKVGKKDADGNIIGILCRATEIFDPRWNELAALLAEKSPFDQYRYYLNKTKPFQLTAREAEILFYLTRGKSTKVIANIIRRSARTVDHHIERIREKFGCASRTELVSMAIKYGCMDMLPRDTVTNLIKKIKAS